MDWHNIFYEFHSFNWLDFVIFILMFLSILKGSFEGFSRAVTTVLGVICGFWAAMNFVRPLALKLSVWFNDPVWPYIIGFLLIFLLVYLSFVVVGIIFKGALKIIRLSWVDNLLGAFVGAVKGMLLVGVLLFLLTLFLPSNSSVLRDSYLYPRFVHFARLLSPLVPEDVRGKFMWKWRHFSYKQNIPNNFRRLGPGQAI